MGDNVDKSHYFQSPWGEQSESQEREEEESLGVF